jgi:methionyl-tRNA formyltransferase
LGADLLLESIGPYTSGEIIPNEQDDEFITFAPRLKKADGKLDFHLTAAKLERQVRAYNPWPSAFFQWEERRIIVHKAHVSTKWTVAPWHVIEMDGFPAVGTAQGSLVLDEVQPAGKRVMAGDQFLRGARGIVNSKVD